MTIDHQIIISIYANHGPAVGVARSPLTTLFPHLPPHYAIYTTTTHMMMIIISIITNHNDNECWRCWCWCWWWHRFGVFEYLVCQYKYPEPPGGEAPIFYRVSSQRSKREERLLNTRKSSQDWLRIHLFFVIIVNRHGLGLTFWVFLFILSIWAFSCVPPPLLGNINGPLGKVASFSLPGYN